MAAALAAAGLVAFVTGSIEAGGYLTGTTTIGLTELPSGPDKDEQIEMLRTLARDTDVTLTLLLPERSGEPNAIEAYVLSGSVSAPVFWGTVIERPADALGDAVILWTYGVDGTSSDVARFLDRLASSGFGYVDETPSLLVGIGALLTTPGLLAIAAMVVFAVTIALVAESARRAPRQRVRRLAGWSRRQNVWRELADVVCLVAGTFAVVCAAFVAFLALRGASDAVWIFCAAQAAMLLPIVITGIAGSHVGFSLMSGTRVARSDVARWRPVVVGVVGLGLVVILASSTTSLAAQRDSTVALERSLTAEAVRGDDVTLGVGFADERQEFELGQIALRAFERGSASMAMTNAVLNAVVVTGDTPGVPEAAERFDGVTVLVPTALASYRTTILDDVRQGFADGWEVDDGTPPRDPPIRTLVVDSARPVVEPIDRWVDWQFETDTSRPETLVVVVSDPRDLAPNRIGTATRNGEVRFADRPALDAALREADVSDAVTQINRVGATIERRLAEVRNERTITVVALLGAILVAVFAALMLAADHRTRSRRARRLRSLVGRHPIADHLAFVTVAASACATVTAVTLALGRSAPVGTLLTAAVGSAAGAALLLAICSALPWATGRTTR